MTGRTSQSPPAHARHAAEAHHSGDNVEKQNRPTEEARIPQSTSVISAQFALDANLRDSGQTAISQTAISPATISPATISEARREADRTASERLMVLDIDSMYLPHAPTDTEKYSYFHKHRRWIFYWLLVGQLGVVYGFVMVAIKTPWTTPALLFLIVVMPPIVVNFWLRTLRPRLNLAQHKANLAAYTPDVRDTVDIWLPTCGEPLRVLRNQYRHVALLRWHAPITVWVLDDADRDEVGGLANEFGFHHVVRPNRGWLKKAGNLIHAFGVSGSRYGVVLDADFVPRHDFLLETIPYMSDPTVGVVQTAQYFDVRREFNYVQRYAGSLQEVFFRWIQPARDVHKAAICAGTNVVYRRAAVEAAGGFAQVPIGEDVHSGIKIWWAGYQTRYLPLALAKGIAPNSFKALAHQQYRWCRSSMLLMVEKHFREAPFSWQQRTAFWAAFLYYMASASLLFTGPLPTAIMLWFFPKYVHAHNYLPMVPAMLATVFVFPLMARGWRPTIYRVCTINSACHLLAVFHALRDRVEEWVPTGMSRKGGPEPSAPMPASRRWRKRKTAKKADVPTKINRILRVWIVLEQTLLWSGILLRVRDGGFQPYWATIALTVVQLYLLAPLLTRGKGLRERTPSARRRSSNGKESTDASEPLTQDAHDMTVMMERIR